MRIKVLLVDDDQIEINQFKACIDWDHLGFEIVGIAINGFFGYQMYQKIKPDLIITDIEMPGMSGVQLAAKIRETDKNVKIIFLSSHEKFEYAHSGYQLNISNYLLKQKLRSDETGKKLLAIKKEILGNLSYDKEEKERVIKNYWKEPLDGSFPDLVDKIYDAVVVFHINTLPWLITQEMYNYFQGGQLVLDRLDAKYPDLLKIPVFGGTLLLFECNDSFQYKKLDLYCLDLLENFDSQVLQPLYYIKLCQNQPVQEVKLTYYRHEQLFLQRYFYPNGCIIDVSEFTTEVHKDIKLETELLDHMGELQGFYLLESYMDEIFQPIIQQKRFQDFLSVVQFLLYYLKQASRKLYDFNHTDDDSLNQVKKFASAATAEKAVAALKKLLQSYYKLLSKNNELHYSDNVKGAIRFIIEHYQDSSMDINQIADFVLLSPVRLRTIFKSETDSTIHQYITRVRMEKTKQILLTDKKKKLDEVAKEAGYLNGRYLSRVFKKEFGITPEEFKHRGKA